MISLSSVKGAQFARVALALAKCQGDYVGAAQFAKHQWRDTPAVAECLIRMSAVAGGDPNAAAWASELSPFGFDADFVQAVRSREVISRLPGTRRAPFRVNISRETSGAGGGWVSPGEGIPVSKSTFDTMSIDSNIAGVIVVLTAELKRLISPAAEENFRESLIAGVAEFLDQQFLDPAVSAVAYSRPASITNGAQQISSTGSTAALITADLADMLDAVDDLISPVWIANAKTVAHLALTLGREEIKIQNGFLLGFPLIATKSSPATTGSPAMPRLLTLLDANAVVVADDGEADVRVSTSTTLEQSDAPVGNAASGTAQTQNMVSMFQSNSAAVRVLRRISWQRVRATSCAFMEVDY